MILASFFEFIYNLVALYNNAALYGLVVLRGGTLKTEG